MEEKEGVFTFEDDKGQKKELEVYLTYHSEQFNKDYIVFIDPDDDTNLLAAVYDDDNNIYDIETEAEYNELDKVIDEFQKEEDKD